MKKRKSSPPCEDIKAARLKAGHTQAQAAEIMHVSSRSWQYWEQGKIGIPIDTWHMYQIKTGQSQREPLEAAIKIHDSVNK